MDASQQTQAPAAEARAPCPSCGTDNGASARFCRRCGAALRAPPECPACKAAVAPGATFCTGCGAKLVGARPTGDVKPLAADLPKAPARPQGSNMVGNVLLFLAVLSVFGVVMYEVNKDAPKTTSPFEGPPPGMAAAGGPGPATSPPAPQGPPVAGVVKVDPGLGDTKEGTLFIVLRNAGMPDKGPPVAVKKIDGPRFPQRFEVGPGDAMMPGMPFTGPFDVYARLDMDGNAMTRAPGDLSADKPASGATPGGQAVELVLDKRL